MITDYFLTFGAQVACLTPLVFLAIFTQRTIKPIYLAAAFSFLSAEFFLTIAGAMVGGSLYPWLQWNWVGKAASFLLSTAIILLLPALRKDSGIVLQLNRERMSASLLTLALLLVAGIYGGMHNVANPARLETALFEATMPSLAEELTFRGIFLCLLNRALGMIGSSTICWGVPIVIIWFGLVHGTTVTDGTIAFAWSAIFSAGTIGAVLMYLRLISGSVLLPIVGHSVFNVAATCVPMLD